MRALAYRTEIVIHRPPQDVFEFCSDLRSELQWNPKVKHVDKLTDGPVGVGTHYRAQWANSGPTAVQVTQFDRPRRWETDAKTKQVARSSARNPGGHDELRAVGGAWRPRLGAGLVVDGGTVDD